MSQSNTADQTAPTVDIDDEELRAAQAELQQELNGGGGDGDGQQEGQGEEGGDHVAPPAPGGDDQQGIQGQGQQGAAQRPAPAPVPYERFHQANKLARQERDRRTFLEGQLAAREDELARLRAGQPAQQGQQGQTAPAPAPKTPAEIIAEQNEAIDKAADDFDNGKISMAEFKKLERQAQQVIAEASRPEPQQSAAPAPSLADEQLLQQHAAELNARYPAVMNFTPEQLNQFAQGQLAMAKAEGKPIDPNTTRGLMELRERVVRWADYTARSNGMQIPAAPSGGQNPPANPNPKQQQNLSPQAQARAQKFNLQASLPPNTANMGSGTDSGDLSDEAIMAMSEDEIGALPASVQNRVLSRG